MPYPAAENDPLLLDLAIFAACLLLMLLCAEKVDRKATKLEIKQAVEKLFGKKVVSVNTANYQGKKKRERRADFGRTASWKKAIVKLKEGETIDLV